MKYTAFPLLIFALIISTYVNAQDKIELPFYDDFSDDYENWTTCSVTGDDQWHLSGDDGIDGSKCARFYIQSNPTQANDDWLISKAFNTEGISNIAIEFKFWYHGDGQLPEFYYTDNFTGDINTTHWTEIDNSFWKNDWRWNDTRIELTNSENNLVFAIRYKSTAEKSNYILIDNFSIKSYTPIIYTFSDSTEYFKVYTNLQDGEDYWNEISEDVDTWYLELCSFWDRPGITPVFDPETKTVIYLLDPENFQNQADTELPNWKCSFSRNNSSLITKLPEGENSIYGNSFSTLIKNTLGQFVLNKKYPGDVENYFSEGFGLFYSGYQPKRDSILRGINELGHQPSVDVLKNIDNLATTYLKDFVVSKIEAQALSVSGIQNCLTGGLPEHWYNHLEYYYYKPDNKRIKLQKQSKNFNIYSADQDIPYLATISEKLEERLSYYTNSFQFSVYHHFNCVIYPNSETGDDCLIYSEGYNGGSGWSGDKLDLLSPIHFGGGIDEALKSLIPHEFFHVFHFNMVKHLFAIPGFHSEGMAEIMAYENDNDEYLINRGWYFKVGLERFKNENGREPKLADIIPDTDGYMSVYSYGQAFWHFMHKNHADYETIKNFFTSGLDWGVFDIAYDEIDKGYINYLKSLAGITTTVEKETVSLKTWLESSNLIIQNAYQTNQNLFIGLYSITGQQIIQEEIYLFPGEKRTISIPSLNQYSHLIIKIKSHKQTIVNKLFNSGS